jgi:hypothetical protein
MDTFLLGLSELLALVRHLPVAHGDDLGLLGLLLRGVRNDDATVPVLRLLETLDEDAVVERAKLDLGSGRHGPCLLLSWSMTWGLYDRRCAGMSPSALSTHLNRVLI